MHRLLDPFSQGQAYFQLSVRGLRAPDFNTHSDSVHQMSLITFLTSSSSSSTGVFCYLFVISIILSFYFSIRFFNCLFFVNFTVIILSF